MHDNSGVFFWAALPPGADSLELLEEVAGLAEPLLDLRYGTLSYRQSILARAVEQKLEGLTVIADSHDDVLLGKLSAGCRVILTNVGQGKEIASLCAGLGAREIVSGVEVDSRFMATQAAAAGADFLVASAYEAYGPVSSKTSLILVQELLDDLQLPLVIRGGLGPRGAAAAVAAGCSGCILDSQLLLVEGTPLSPDLKEILGRVTPTDTVVLGELLGRPHRLLVAGSQEALKALAQREKDLLAQESGAETFEHAVVEATSNGLIDGAPLLPVGQGIAFSQQFARGGLCIREVLRQYHDVLARSVDQIKQRFPLTASGSRLAKQHSVSYPIVQGPMACISDNPNLAREVAEAGALPFLAAAGLTGDQTRQLLIETQAALKEHPFGVGIIGFSTIDPSKSQLEAVLTCKPRVVTIAGGDPAMARRCEQAGVGAYLHAPTLSHVQDFLDKQVAGIILEGHEAGGHVGSLGSLILWELSIREIVERGTDGISGPLRLLLAGGIASARGALAAAVLAVPLEELDVAVGLQLGTAYLMTEEAVSSKAISEAYSRALLRGDRTAITGRSVNLPSQWLSSPSIQEMISEELALEREGLPLHERKDRIALRSRDTLRRAVRGEEKAAYMCGQMISVQRELRTMAELHEELTRGAEELAKTCSVPSPSADLDEGAVAVIGIGCVFPRADNPTQFWENILNRVDTIREVPKDRWDPALYYDPERGVPGKTYSKIGAFVEGFEKDPLKFRIPPVSAPVIDRVQFLTLESAHQALADAGYLDSDFPREHTGVFIGNAAGGELQLDYHLRVHWERFVNSLKSVDPALTDDLFARAKQAFTQDLPPFTEDSCGGAFNSIIAGRVCNVFNLGGPGVVVDNACASSLAAVNAGMTALREGRVDLALAGGVDVRVHATVYALFSSLGAISAKGSFPFDERADGFVLGEGAGIVLLKRLAEARRDGDRIYAVVRAVGSSSDGRVKGITAPDVEGQLRALVRAYEQVPFTPDTLSLVEAHGTGTWVGDRAEVASLTHLIRKHSQRQNFIGLGTVKSMIGHLKAAAGIAGLIKAVLALHHRVLPPTINCEQPRKEIDWESSPFYLVTEPRPWSGPSPRRAAVDSFGFGGINYHAVLEEAPPVRSSLTTEATSELPAELLVFRAESRQELTRLVERVRDQRHDNLRRLALELTDHLTTRGPTLAVVAPDAQALASQLDRAIEVLNDASREEYASDQGIYFGQVPLGSGERVAFLFPGQGTQYAGMGGDLAFHFPAVQRIFERVDSIAAPYVGQTIMSTLTAEPTISEQERARLTEILVRPMVNHPALLAMGMALGSMLRLAGVRPDMVAGHSLGELIALHDASVFDETPVIKLAAIRGRGIHAHSRKNGAMASVSTSAEVLEPILEQIPGYVVVANKNCPAQTVISGELDAIQQVMQILAQRQIPCKQLNVSSGFHSKLLEPCVPLFREYLEQISIQQPVVPVQSNLTGKAYDQSGDFPSRLKQTLLDHMTKPVEFIKNIRSMAADGARLFIEVGPRATICSFVSNILADTPHWAIPTNLPKRPATLQLLHALAFCAARGLDVDVRPLLAASRRRRALHRAVGRPPRILASVPVPAVTEAPASPDPMTGLLDATLNGQDPRLVQRYLEQRGEAVREMLDAMVRVDFSHFAPEQAASTSAEQPTLDRGLEQLVVQLIADKTGYPQEEIDIDLDVEAELGLDSIKQVEVIRELAQRLQIDFGEDPRSQRYAFPTPRKLIEAAAGLLDQKGQHAPKKESVPEQRQPEAELNLDCHRWVCEPVEVDLSQDADPDALRGKRVLLLCGADGPGPLLEQRLVRSGAMVCRLSGELSDELPDELPDQIDTVVDLLSFGEDELPSASSCTDWWSRLSGRASFLLQVSQHIMRTGAEPLLWVEVTSLGGQLGGQALEQVPSLAGIGLAISRAMTQELEGRLEGLFLDFDATASDEDVATRASDELCRQRLHNEMGYRQGRRYEIHWRQRDAVPSGTLPIDEQGVVLAIGGARGITASICNALTRERPVRLVVVGRHPIEADLDLVTFEVAREALREELGARGERMVPSQLDHEAWQRVRASERSSNMRRLAKKATQAVYHQCDITDLEATRRLIDDVYREYGRLDLVIQGGGDLYERSIRDFDAQAFIDGMRSKALGTACLLASLADRDVGCFVNISSAGGRWCNRGQASYGSGHEVADILVDGTRKRRSGQWINIFFGPWFKLGMTSSATLMDRLRRLGRVFLTETMGTDFFIKELASGSSHSVAFCGTRSGRLGRQGRTSLLDKVEIVSDGRAEGRRLFDPQQDRFVGDHFVRYEHAILPGVVSLELMAQTASVLVAPDLELTGIDDIAFLRAGTFPRGEPRQFFTRALLHSDGSTGELLTAEVFSQLKPVESAEPQEVTHARCSLRFGRRPPPPHPSLVVVSAGAKPCAVDADPLWDTAALSHRKGLFRNVSTISSITRDGVVGQAKAPVVQAFGNRPYLGNPIRLDGTFELAAPAIKMFFGHWELFVGTVGSIRFYANEDDQGPRTCRLSIQQLEAGGLVFNAEMMNGMGEVAEQITDIRLESTQRPESIALSEPIWQEMRDKAGQAEIRDLLGCTETLALAHVPLPLIRGALHDDSIQLSDQLGDSEHEHLSRLTHAKRRAEWLAGRIAAKGALRILLEPEPPPARSILIDTAQDKAPRVTLEGATDGNSLHVSIAHSNEWAVALATQQPGFGIDVEQISDRIEGILETFTTAEELERARRWSGKDTLSALTALWTVKEAARKAVGPQTCPMQELVLEQGRQEGQYLICSLFHPQIGSIRGVVFESDGYVYAVSCIDAHGAR